MQVIHRQVHHYSYSESEEAAASSASMLATPKVRMIAVMHNNIVRRSSPVPERLLEGTTVTPTVPIRCWAEVTDAGSGEREAGDFSSPQVIAINCCLIKINPPPDINVTFMLLYYAAPAMCINSDDCGNLLHFRLNLAVNSHAWPGVHNDIRALTSLYAPGMTVLQDQDKHSAQTL